MVAITCDPSERVLGVQLQRRPTPLVQGRSGTCMEGRYGSLFRSIILALPIGTVCWPGAVLAQTTRTPREVEALPDDTAKVFSLADQCFAYRRKDVDSALMFGERALRLARSLKFPKGEAQALNDLAIIHIDRSAYADADSALRRALSIRRSLGDRAGVGAIHNKLGNLYQSQLRLEEALEQNQQALSIFNTLGDRSKEALILSNIAVINFNMRQYDQALEYHRAAADMHRGPAFHRDDADIRASACAGTERRQYGAGGPAGQRRRHPWQAAAPMAARRAETSKDRIVAPVVRAAAGARLRQLPR